MIQKRIYDYFERNERLKVLFVFDKSDVVKSELEEACWEEGYVYKVFDGAWFSTKYAIENEWKGKRVVLLFPLSTFPQTEEEMLRFPLLDLLLANMEFKEENYESFMQQYGLPKKYAALIKRNITEITSKKMTGILSGQLSAETMSEDVICRGFVSSYLGEKTLLEWSAIVVRMIALDLEGEEKKRDDFYRRLQKNRDAKAATDNKMNSLFGVSYNANSDIRMKQIAECLKYNALTQLLDAPDIDPYKTLKTKDPVRLAQMNRIIDTAKTEPAYQEKFNRALGNLASGIKEETIIDIYGIDADYFHLSDKLCWRILKGYLKERIYAEPDKVSVRMKTLSLKMPQSSETQVAIKMVSWMAQYYAKAKGITTLKLNSPDEYVRRYTSDYYKLDMSYRLTLEAYHELLGGGNPVEADLGEAKRRLDKDYAQLVNEMNLEWLKCVRGKGDLFDTVSLPKQEGFYWREVDAKTKKVVIVCDALRYEVAAELMQELAKKKHIARISAMRAMLPTETKYCKPALLPHKTLKLAGNDMEVDGKVLSDLDSRGKHLSEYFKGAAIVSYEYVMSLTESGRRELMKRPLVYVMYDTIDEASHTQSPFEVIRACRTAVKQLDAFVNSLHATWNVTYVTLTADHGFIYNDMAFEEKDKHPVKDECIEKKTRYFLAEGYGKTEGVTVFPLDKVSGMSVDKATYVAVPTGTNRLAAPGGYQFAHGGATRQEMIVPVIHSVGKREVKTEKVGVTLMNSNLTMVSSQVKVTLIQSEAVSMKVTARTVLCSVYEGDKPVTEVRTLTLDSHDEENLNNRVYSLTLTLNQSVSSTMLELRVYDKDDNLNPLIKATVMNETLIERDFD